MGSLTAHPPQGKSAPWRALAKASACLFFLLAGPAGAGSPSAEDLYRAAKAAKLEGRVLTVRGPVDPPALGPTLMHEHLFIDWFDPFPWTPTQGPSATEAARMQASGWPLPSDAAEIELFSKRDLSLGDIELLRRGARSRSNYVIDDEALVAREVSRFQDLGGRTIVDLTPDGLGRDVERLARFSRATGVNVVSGAAWYRWPFHPDWLKTASVEDLTAKLVASVVQGEGASKVRAGMIGEIPLDSRSVRDAAGLANAEVRVRSETARTRLLALPAHERNRVPVSEIYDAEELKVLRAAARASRLTGAALSLHANDPWIGYLSVLEAEGADLSRTIVGHAHYIFRDRELLKAALGKGVVLQADYDLQQYPTRAPVGAFNEILDGVGWAITNGYAGQVLLSQDICNKIGLQAYGGGGYATLHAHVFPYLRARGVTEAQLREVMVSNPARLLTLVAPQRVRR